MGWVRHTDTYGMYEERIKPIINIKKLKKVVSKKPEKAESGGEEKEWKSNGEP